MTCNNALKDTIAFYDRTADEYAARWDGFVDDNLVRFAASTLPGPVADIGCGTGRDLLALTSRGLQVVGVDLSAGMLERAATVTDAPLVQADMCALPFANGSLSGLWLSASLLHLPSDLVPSALLELYRVAAAGAPLFISVKAGNGEGLASDGRFFSYHTPDGLSALLSDAGWVDVDVTVDPDAFRPDVIWLAVHAVKA